MNRLKRWVRQNGGPSKIAKDFGVTRQSVQAWMRGARRPKVITAQKLSRLSRIPLATLLNISK